MNLPDTPKGWAGRLSIIYKTFCFAHGIVRFPIDVSSLALEYSKQLFPNEPITGVQGEDFDQFEGALVPNGDRNGWLIIYSRATQNPGRINFTIAHELGHYLLHRQRIFVPKECTRGDLLSWQLSENNIETEANSFAANFLMPADDFSKQIYDQEISLDLIKKLADRYGVSLNALALQLSNLIKQPAMIVFGKDGFIDWAWSNERLMKLGIYYSAKQKTIELPHNSLVNCIGVTDILHDADVWIGPGKVREILIYHKEEFSLSLLLYDGMLSKEDIQEKLNEDKEESF